MQPASNSSETLAATVEVGNEGQREEKNQYLPPIKLVIQTNRPIRF